MNILTRLKIGQRLALSFAFVLALTLAVGVFSVNRIGHVNDATAELATNWFPALRALGDYRGALNGIRRTEALHTMASTDEAWAKEEKQIQDTKVVAQTAWKAYSSTVSGDEERQIAAAVEQAQASYFAAVDKVLASSRGGADKLEATKAIYNGESHQAFNTLLQKLLADIAFQNKGTEAAYARSQASFEQTRIAVIGLVLAAIAIGSGLALVITRSITRPIARAVEVAETVAAGDLTSDVHTDRTDETGQLLMALKRMNDSLVTIVSQVRNGSDSIATGSSQISSGNADLSQRTEEQASALQQTAATMEQLSTTVNNNSDSARQASQLAIGASTVAIKGGNVVTRVVDTMKGINDASRKISDIISVIDGIAFQTNILALNAAVEAARAGEQGRGFAVVAGEVRTLAQRSANAAKEIKSLITDSVERVSLGTALVDEAGQTMQEIVGAVQRVSDIVAEISAASVQQSSGIGQVGQAVSQMDQVTQQNAALVEESAAAAESLKLQAQQLVNAVAVFKVSSDAAAAAEAATHGSAHRSHAHQGRKPVGVSKLLPSTPPATSPHAKSLVKPFAKPHAKPLALTHAMPEPPRAIAAPAKPAAPTQAESPSTEAANAVEGDDWQSF
ncbi:MAG: MCP four helix bundle domain-containing protein [Burkholderiales bacterium]|nr:MCP four helix bundle domain-containing protein [Burkholderiales bacterium]MBH2015827.1 MCP four helix bundle domain-containing protein [Burkholderiales bacterium]